MEEKKLSELSDEELKEAAKDEMPVVILKYFSVKKGEGGGTILECKIRDSAFDRDLKHAITSAARELGVLIGMALNLSNQKGGKKFDA